MTRWTLARRTAAMNPSALRELLKVAEQPGIVSLAGGLPSADTFPVPAMAEACERVLRTQPRQALQYAASEGHGPLREWVAAQMQGAGLACDAAQVLITSGSQQGLDLVAKILIDAGERVAVEQPTYLGALQAFTPYEPTFHALVGDDEGPMPEALAQAGGARFVYLIPNFQNPTGRCMSAARRLALVAAAERAGVPIVEDNPYGELWFDAPPPPPLAASAGDNAVYLGSFSKVLAPGLRLGYAVAPRALFPKLLQAKQAADLHTPTFNQRVVYEVIKDGFLDTHVPLIRERYRAQRDAMLASLQRHLPPGCRYQAPVGGMFFWVQWPQGVDTTALLPAAVAAGVAYVPGAPFFAGDGRAGVSAADAARTMRLSFVTVTPEQIEHGIATLARVFDSHLAGQPAPAFV